MITWSEKIFQKHYANAVKSVDDLIVGDTYYSNTYPRELTVIGINSDVEHAEKYGRTVQEYHTNAQKWIIYGPDECDIASLSDHNIGAHYNPWMIFRTKEDRDACVAELEPTIGYEDRHELSVLDDQEYFDYVD